MKPVKDDCGVKRKYKTAEDVKIPARELGLKWHHCPRCNFFHLTTLMDRKSRKKESME